MTPRLTLSTKTHRSADVVVIDGRRYTLLDRATASVGQLLKIDKLRRSLAEIAPDADDLTPDQAATVAVALDGITRVLLPDAPDAVHDKLTDVHRLSIIQAYLAPDSSAAPPSPRARRR